MRSHTERERRRRDRCITAGPFWGIEAGRVTSCVVAVWIVVGQGELLKKLDIAECWLLKGWRVDATLWSSIYWYTIDVFTCTFSYTTPRKFDLPSERDGWQLVCYVKSPTFRATSSWLWSDEFKRDRISREKNK